MKSFKAILIICLIFILLFSGSVFADEYYYNSAWHTHNENISLYINQSQFKSDIPPLIVNGRTLVPARAFFEALGATLSWDDVLKLVVIEKDDYTIKLTIDNIVAYVNGKTAVLDVPPQIFTDKKGVARTLIPVRFVSSWLGYEVTWNENTKSVGINTQKKNIQDEAKQEIKNKITKIETSCTDNKDIINIYFSEKTEPKIMKLSDPSRLVADFYGLDLGLKGTSAEHGGACYTNIRFASHEDYSRIVIDIAFDYTYSVSTDSEKCIISLTKTGNTPAGGTQTVTKPSNTQNSGKKPDSTDEATTSTPTTNINKTKINNVVVIDPGHGGSDPGAIGEFDDDKLYESECTLDISLKLQKVLENNGIKTYMTRTEDEFVGLVERANYANDINAALFTCVHINAATVEGANGSQVYYYTGDSDSATKEIYGVTSKEFAKNVLDGVIKYAKRYNRGIADGSKFVVMHRTIMPAVLVECAFITNEEEYELLKTDSFRQKLAEGIAEGVIKTLKEMGRL